MKIMYNVTYILHPLINVYTYGYSHKHIYGYSWFLSFVVLPY